MNTSLLFQPDRTIFARRRHNVTFVVPNLSKIVRQTPDDLKHCLEGRVHTFDLIVSIATCCEFG